MADNEKRLWEVDFLRGLAVLMMLVSNFVFDLSFFSYIPVIDSGAWYYLARLTAASFLAIVGISLSVSFARSGSQKNLSLFVKYSKRAVKIFSLGMIITIITRYAIGEGYIAFGILHLIGLSIWLAWPFLGHTFSSFCCGVAVIAVGVVLNDVMVQSKWLFWLGLQYQGFFSVDYVPVFPWFGSVLIGISLGGLLFSSGEGRFSMPRFEQHGLVRLVRKLGRHSLVIYFVHQPVFWIGFWVAKTV